MGNKNGECTRYIKYIESKNTTLKERVKLLECENNQLKTELRDARSALNHWRAKYPQDENAITVSASAIKPRFKPKSSKEQLLDDYLDNIFNRKLNSSTRLKND